MKECATGSVFLLLVIARAHGHLLGFKKKPEKQGCNTSARQKTVSKLARDDVESTCVSGTIGLISGHWASLRQ